MTPIYEQADGHGIGHGFDSFLKRFDIICAEHLASNRANSFAFIFYDFNNRPIREVLKNQGVFARLDRLSGRNLSIFYLHAKRKATVRAFNQHFFRTLGIEGEVVLPCVVFFRVQDGEVRDIEIAQLESADLIHGFHELYGAVSQYLLHSPAASAAPSRAIRWLKGSANLLTLEAFRAAIKKGFELLF